MDIMIDAIMHDIVNEILNDPNTKMYIIDKEYINTPIANMPFYKDGIYMYKSVDIREAKEIVREHWRCNSTVSLLGNKNTVDLINKVMGTDFEVINGSTDFTIEPYESVLIFIIKREDDGWTLDDLKHEDFEIGFLVRLQ